MKLINIYEDVSNVIKISNSQKFIDAVSLASDDLLALYSPKYVFDGDELIRAEKVDGEINLHNEYYTAIVAYVLFKLTGSEGYFSEYLSRADYAYRSVWRRLAKGMRKSTDTWY